MNTNAEQELAVLDGLIKGRVEPEIYAFSTEKVQGYMKVGDTFRGVDVRLQEWAAYFPDLIKRAQFSAYIESKDAYFRDFSVHQYLLNEGGHQRLTEDLARKLDVYYSSEFFRDVTVQDVTDAVQDVREQFGKPGTLYTYYTNQRLQISSKYKRTETYEPRRNQQEAIERFHKAIEKGHNKLLLYAVMRFGKSFTAMCCAQEKKARLVLVLSAKADVEDEWKRTVESHVRFEKYSFLTKSHLKRNNKRLSEEFDKNNCVVLFLTLQDLCKDKIKREHQELFDKYNDKIDLLIVDETHFGARAARYGRVLDEVGLEKSIDRKKEWTNGSDTEDIDRLDEALKRFHPQVTLHLSGTPYRILMSGEFDDESIISSCSYSDIATAQKQWDDENVAKPENERRPVWENPYFGFPQMIRFAFNPSKRALELMDTLKKQGRAFELNALFQPVSIPCDTITGSHRKFVHEAEVLDFLQVIDGKQREECLFSFLDYERIKSGKMCRHLVFVLPFCASCDAMAALLQKGTDECLFKNLHEYKVLNIAGHDSPYKKNVDVAKNSIAEYERNGIKTISLTVNKMLTGTTVREWDTMLFLKNAASPQEYDQAVFRLQNPYVVRYSDTSKRKRQVQTIYLDKKPQTLLVDFCPNRLFYLQQQKVLMENIRAEARGNEHLQASLEKVLAFSPVIAYNAEGKLEKVNAARVMEAVSNYSKSRSVLDESMDIPLDFALLKDAVVGELLRHYAPITSTKGIFVKQGDGEGTGLDLPPADGDIDNSKPTSATPPPCSTPPSAPDGTDEQTETLQHRLSTFYALILYYSCLTNSKVSNLKQIIKSLHAGREKDNNIRIASNLRLDEELLKELLARLDHRILYNLETKIENINCRLMNDTRLSPLERSLAAMKKLGRLSSAEVVLPDDKAEEIVRLLPEGAITDNTKVLDISAKNAEFAVALCKRYSPTIGCKLLKNIYALPSSKISYEFTRKIFSILGIPVKNVFDKYVDKDILSSEELQNDLRKMKFDVIVGNPPYQEESLNTRKPPIYHLFYQTAFKLADKVSLITPGRFLYRAGHTPKEWMDTILADKHVKVVQYFQNSTDVFPSVGIRGGVVVTYRDAKQDFGGIGSFSVSPELASIMNKVEAHESFERNKFASLVSSQGIYRFSDALFVDFPKVKDVQGKGTMAKITSSSLEKLPEIFHEEQPDDGHKYIQMIGLCRRKRVTRWIREDYIQETPYLDCYKVFVPEANGSGAIGEVLSSPMVGMPMIGHTDTFLSIGQFHSRTEAENCLKYIQTKFARTLLGSLKATQHNPKDTWANVPMQDFSDNGDIDWSGALEAIDAQLYDKYGMEKEERSFMESVIKPM